MSIIDNLATHATNRVRHHTACGGDILAGDDHAYCAQCGAVAYYGEDSDEQTWEEALATLQNLKEGESNI